MARIVVGVDGSADSRAALRWAVDEARRRDADVAAVYVYGLTEEHNPFLAAYSSFASGSSAKQAAGDAQRWREERQEELQRQADGVLASIVRDEVPADTDVKVERSALPGGRPARALLDEASDCSLLVIGARGRGGFKGLRLGAVAEKCVRHADCSVIVVRS
jgi:nucleotide-binding universal stress UspA family protein